MHTRPTEHLPVTVPFALGHLRRVLGIYLSGHPLVELGVCHSSLHMPELFQCEVS
jgi:hypothetical protein